MCGAESGAIPGATDGGGRVNSTVSESVASPRTDICDFLSPSNAKT